MTISPVALGLGIAGGVGISSTVAMAISGQDNAQKIRQGTTIFGLSTAGILGTFAVCGRNLGATWSAGGAKLTGMTEPGHWATIALGPGVGVAAANAAAEWVLDVNKNSLVSS